MHTKNAHITHPPSAYLTEVKALSDRIVKAQQPIRILDAIKWDDTIKQAFFASHCKKMPGITPEYYQGRPLGLARMTKSRSFIKLSGIWCVNSDSLIR